MTQNKFYSYFGYCRYILEIDITWEQAQIIDGLKRLSKKHHRLAEMDCNGEGVIRGVHYYAGTIDDYARHTYGANVKSAYQPIPEDCVLSDENTIFEVESFILEGKIRNLANALGDNFEVKFQGDPRGCTVRLQYVKPDKSWYDVTELFFI